MAVKKKIKLRGRGGPGRGQGRLPMKNKRIKISANIPYSMLTELKKLQETTGDSFSSTIVWVLDHGLSVIKNN